MAGGPEALDVVVARLTRIAGEVPAGRGAGLPQAAEVAWPTLPAPEPSCPTGWVPEPPAPRPTGLTPSARDAGGTDDTTDDATDDATAARLALSAAMASYTAAHGHPLGADDTDGPRRFRLAVGARVAAAAVVALLLVVGVVAVRAWQRTSSAAVALPPISAAAADDGAEDGAPGPARGAASDASAGSLPAVVVHVVGEVARPGVVALEPGARVADAVAAAGGATPSADLTAINLARVLADGEQVVVPAPGQAAAAAPSGGTGTGTGGGGLLDLNRADAAGFDTLPGIGPVLAERIVAWRDEHGRFTAVEELTEVTGIGPALLAGVRDLVQVG